MSTAAIAVMLALLIGVWVRRQWIRESGIPRAEIAGRNGDPDADRETPFQPS
jgi:hypothetical protein